MSTPSPVAELFVPHAHTAVFKMAVKSCFYLDAHDFSNGCAAVYGQRIDIIESPNDTTHEYTVGPEEPLLFDEDKLARVIASGYVEADYAEVVLHDLYKRGVLPAGDYFIRVSW